MAVPRPGNAPTATPRPTRRWRRWLGRTLRGLGVLVLLLVAVVAGALWGLDRPFIKRRVQALALEEGGVEIDYGATRVRPWSGLRVEALVVASPARFRGLAPRAARVGTVEIGWSLSSLRGDGPPLTGVTLRDVEVVMVRDEAGRISLAELGPPPSATTTTPTPGPTPPGRLLEELLAKAPPAERIAIEGLAVTVIQSEKGGAVERLSLRGVGLQLAAAREGPRWQLHLDAGTAAAPLSLEVERERDGAAAGSATARLWLGAAAHADRLEATIDLEVVRQTLAPAIDVHRLLHVEAAARFPAALGRTDVTLARGELADGAASFAATLELPDDAAAPSLVRTAEGAIDLGRLIPLVPARLLRVTAERAGLRYRVAGLALAATGLPRLVDGGSATIEGNLTRVRVPLGARALLIDEGRFSLEARPGPGGVTRVRAEVPLRAVELGGASPLRATGLALTVAGSVAAEGALGGDVTLAFASIDAKGPPLRARGGSLAVKLDGLHLDRAAPLASRGDVTVTGKTTTLDVAQGRMRAIAEGIGWTVHARLTGHPPYQVDVDLPISSLRLLDARGKPLLRGRTRLGVHLTEVHPDAARPLASRGEAAASVEVGAFKATVHASKKNAEDVDFDVDARADNLAALRLLEPATRRWEVPWEQLALGLRVKGGATAISSATPEVHHRTELRLEKPAFRGPGGTVAARASQLVLTARGTARHHEADARVSWTQLRIGGTATGDGHLQLKAKVDLGAPWLELALDAGGEAGPAGRLTARLGFDRARRALSYDVDGKLGHLALLAPLAPPGLDLSKLELGVRGKGSVLGLVEELVTEGPRAGVVRLVARPQATVAVDGTLELRVAPLHFAEGQREVSTPGVTLRATMRVDGATRRALHADLKLDGLHVESGGHGLDLDGLTHATDVVVSGDLAEGQGEVTSQVALRVARQTFVPPYPVGEVTLRLRARRNRDGVVHVEELRLENPAGGTTLQLSGGVDPDVERRSLSLRGTVQQDLTRAWTEAHRYVGRGAATVELRVDSGNFALFHTFASLRVSGATVKLPDRGIELEGLDGEIPIVADILVDRAGPRLLRDAPSDAYSELRFADQHPFLSRRSFLSARRIVTPLITVGPLAANLRVEHNVVSLSQLDVGLRNGRLTGHCIIDYRGRDSRLQLNLRASHVEASRGEPFDGNTAVVITARDRGIEGRAEILRISRRHLLDLLDIQDPHHGDAAINRVRRGLSLGYPDRVRLAFNQGFASVRVTLGGVGKLVSIDEIRGIPIGPLVDRVLGQLGRAEGGP